LNLYIFIILKEYAHKVVSYRFCLRIFFSLITNSVDFFWKAKTCILYNI